MRLSPPIVWTAALGALLACAAPAWAQDGTAKPDAGADAQPAAKPQETPEAKPEAEPEPESAPEAKPDASPEAKPDAGPVDADAETPAQRRRRRRRPRLTPRLPRRRTTLEIAAGGFLSFFDGSSRKDTPNSIGTRIEFDEVALDDIAVIVPLELQVHITNRFTLLTDFFLHSASGTERTVLPYTFDGATIPAGTTLDADLDVITAVVAARYFASSSQYGTFEIEAGLRYVGIELAYSAGGSEAVETTDAFIPFVGFHGTLHFTEWQNEKMGLEAGGRVGLLAIGDSTDNQTNAYLHAYIRFAIPLPFASAGRFRTRLTLGYEYLFIDAEREDDNADEDFELLFHGPAVGIELSF